jgi:hypothetical protein
MDASLSFFAQINQGMPDRQQMLPEDKVRIVLRLTPGQPRSANRQPDVRQFAKPGCDLLYFSI